MITANLKSRLSTKIQQAEAKKEPLDNVSETAVIPVVSDYVALTTNALAIINENLKNQPLSRQSIDVIKAPTGGLTAFSVPSLTGDEIQKELTGIILDYTTPRAYWDTPDPIEGTPPICYSLDSVISHERKPCSQCPFNTFGSKDGDSNAKACKESVELYLLQPDSIMPIVVRIPVSSKILFQKYLIRLVSKMIPICGVVTKITLTKATNKTGQAYAQFNFEAVKLLEDSETNGARAFGQKFREILTVEDKPEFIEAS